MVEAFARSGDEVESDEWRLPMLGWADLALSR
jgi:hypothetical protein